MTPLEERPSGEIKVFLLQTGDKLALIPPEKHAERTRQPLFSTVRVERSYRAAGLAATCTTGRAGFLAI